MMNQANFTRRLSLLVWLLVAGALAGCTRGTPAWFEPPPRQVRPERVGYSYVVLADLRAADQLGPGWYEIENGAFRWMARRSTVYLKRPESGGAVLEVRLYLPENLILKVGAPTLEIWLDGKLLSAARLPRAGEYVLKEQVVPARSPAGPAQVELRLDRSMPPSGSEQRQLGAVVTGVGFRPGARRQFSGRNP